MAGELDRLLIRIEADTAILRKALADSEKDIDGFTNKVDKNLAKSERRFSSFGASIGKSLSGVAGAMAAAFGLNAAKAAAGEIAGLETLAQQAGMTAEKYQALRAAAQVAGSQTSEFDQVMSRFAERVGAAHARTGDLYEFLRTALPTVAQQIQGTKDTTSAFNLMLDTISRLSSAEERAIVIKHTFGETTAGLAKMLGQGSDAMANAADKARELGLVLDDSALEAAKKNSAEFARLSAILDGEFKRGIVNILPGITAVTKALADMVVQASASSVASTPDYYGMDDLKRAASSLEKELMDVNAAAVGVEKSSWTSFLESLGFSNLKAKGLAEQLRAVNAEIDKRNNLAPVVDSSGKPNPAAVGGKWDTTVTKGDGLKLQQKGLGSWETTLDFKTADALADLRKATAAANQDHAGVAMAEYDAELEKFRRMLAEKELSQEEFEAVRVQLSQNSGIKLAEALKQEEEKYRSSFSELEGMITSTFGSALESAIKTGKVAWKELVVDFMAGMARMIMMAQVMKPLMDSLFSSQNSLAGGISAIFAPGAGRANGGPVAAGVPYMTGERGPEPVVPHAASYVQSRSMMASGGNGGGSSTVYNIDARGADIGAADRIREAIGASSNRSSVAEVQAYRKRFPTRG